MKLTTIILCTLTSSLFFGQQATNSNLNYPKSNDILVETKKSDFSLNLKKFKLSQLYQVNNPHNRKFKTQRSLMIEHREGTLIVVPNDILFPNIFDTKENSRDIDTIFDFENSIYFFRNAG